MHLARDQKSSAARTISEVMVGVEAGTIRTGERPYDHVIEVMKDGRLVAMLGVRLGRQGHARPSACVGLCSPIAAFPKLSWNAILQEAVR
jgi:hypothetical protein